MSKKSNKKSEKPRTRGETLHPQGRRFRSQFWFDNPNDPNMTALYFERYLNLGLTEKEIIGDRPIIGIAQTGSDLSPCNRASHAPCTAGARGHPRRRRHCAGILLPSHPGDRQATDRGARSQPFISQPGRGAVRLSDRRVVLTTGCDKTTPAAIMAAATVNIPTIVLSGGPMLNGWWKGERAGSGTIKWELSKRLAAARSAIRNMSTPWRPRRRRSAIATPWVPPRP
jgi:dihydroxy-acid dehydratase